MTSSDRERAVAITADELTAAVRLAESTFDDAGLQVVEHVLVGAQWTPGLPGCPGMRCWELVFKPRRLVPTSSDERVGAGGEVHFTVDLDAGRAAFTGYGD
jgi:hypothetical protein